MKKAKGAKRAERGFSLIESMIAAAVFTIGSLGLLGMLVSSSQGMAVSERMTHGTGNGRVRTDDPRHCFGSTKAQRIDPPAL